MKLLYLVLLLLITERTILAQHTSLNENFDATSGSSVPIGWAGSSTLGSNYGTGNFYSDHTSGTGRLAFISNGYLRTPEILAGNYQLSFWSRISSSTEVISLGYCTDSSNISGTFIPLRAINDSTTSWIQRTYSLDLNVTGRIYIVWKSFGGGKTHCFDDVVLSLSSSVSSNENGIPEKFQLEQNYPNPFNPLTVIRYTLLVNGNVNLKVYNVLGQEVATLLNNEEFQAGEHEIEFDASRFSSGIYLYRLTTNKFSETKKMVLLK